MLAVAVFRLSSSAGSEAGLVPGQADRQPRNTVEVTVAELDSRGSAIRIRAEEQPDGAPGLAADITVDSAAELRLNSGERVYFSVKAQEVTLFPSP